MTYFFLLLFLFLNASGASADGSVSPSLFFARSSGMETGALKKSVTADNFARATLRFAEPPDESALRSLESRGVVFFRAGGRILHSSHIYPALVCLDSLESLLSFPGLERIENSFRPSTTSTLDVSNPQVQASRVWNAPGFPYPILGTGVTVVDVDTGVDIFHPAFFKADGGSFSWIDGNSNGVFDPGIDGVDLNGNGRLDPGETLRFYDAPCRDSMSLLSRTPGVFDVDFDWLYNDANGNGQRDFGPQAGFTENSPSFGERMFFVEDGNHNNRLDPGETLTGLGTSKVRVIFDKTGPHLRGTNLLTTTGDLLNHGTGALGIVGGQQPGRRLTGMAPGAEFIAINRNEAYVEESILQARDMGANIFMYEYGGWVFEPLDGSSNMETLIDYLSAQGFHQFTASGNLAGPTRKRHAVLALSPSGSDTLAITIPNLGIKELYISFLWTGKLINSTRPVFSALFPDGSVTPVTGDQVKRTVQNMTIVTGYDYSSRGTGRYDILITSSAPISGTIRFSARNRIKSAVSVHAYLADDVTQWMNGAQFLDHVTDDGTVCTPGTSVKGVTVGAYDPRGTRNIKGDINDFSSWGKTVDGRRGVEITAPGTLVYSLTSSSGTTSLPGGYFEFGGTSAALPHVVGCAALLLEARPGLSPDDLADALERYALQDGFTGSVPNDIWGYGKLRMENVFSGLDIVSSVADKARPSPFSVSEGTPNPFNASVAFEITAPVTPHSPVEITIYNVIGQKVFSTMFSAGAGVTRFTWDGRTGARGAASSGMYFAGFRMDRSQIARKILLLR